VNILLGLRMMFSGGRESLVRMVLMATGVAVGVPLVLLVFTVVPIMQNHTDRLAWHRTTVASPPTAPDHALWLAVTDRYAGRDIVRVHVAALGPRPPVPPGVERLPGPGEKLVSPALARLMQSVPDDQLDDRYPGRVVGGIGPNGLIMPDELVAIVGHTPEQMRAMRGAIEIRGIERPREGADLVALMGIFGGMVAALVLGPVVVFIVMTTRVGGPRREQRFAAVRLAGGTRFQTAVLAATETAIAAIAGTLLGWLIFRALRPVAASHVTLGHGMPIFVEDVAVPLAALLLVLIGVPLLAVGTTLVGLHPVQMTPLGVRHRTRREPPTVRRLVPIGVGLTGIWLTTIVGGWRLIADNPVLGPILGLIRSAAVLCTLIGFFLAGSWVCMWISRGMARVSGSVTTLMVARRIAADPYSTFRAVGGAAIAIYVATSLGFIAAANDQQPRSVHDASLVTPVRPALDPGVVAVHVPGVPEAELAPLMSAGVVIARLDAAGQIVVSCADLARVTDLECPLPHYKEGFFLYQDYLRAEDLFILPYPGSSTADRFFHPSAFVEPGPDTGRLPVQTLLIPTDGTAAAQERVRTLAAVTVPLSRSKTSDDLAPGALLDVSGLATVLPYAMVVVLLFTACSLTVSVITGVVERRTPFALLRASGVRIGELRRVVLLETGAPLAITVLFGVGLATLQSFVTVSPGNWVLPGTGYLAGLGLGVLAAFAVSLIALPFMNTATRFDTVRFE
jgi:hypothetical protein